MKKHLLNVLTATILFLMPNVNFGNSILPPNLGAASSFAYFTADGAFAVTGALTIVTGDVGNDVGAFSAFPPGTLIGNKHHADFVTAQAKIDLLAAFGYMSTIACGQEIGTALGGGTILTPNVYCHLGGAATLNGDLILDGQNDPDALFIFRIGGAFATDFNSHILLTNSASLCNVYWQINGEFDLHGTSVFMGTVIANGGIHITETATLLGRGLSVAGAIDLTNNTVTVAPCLPGGCTIPTLSEWGLIILALMMLAAGMVYIRRRQYSFAMAGSTDVPQEKQSQFNRRSYFIILAVLLGIAMLVFAVEIIFSIAVPVRDIAGALVSSVILAYIIHLLNAFRKE